MIHAIWIFTIAVLAVFLELMTGRYGLLVPVFLSAVFYFMTVYSRWHILVPLGIMAIVLDLSFARSGYLSLIMVAFAGYGAGAWQRHGNCTRPIFQALPGLVLGLTWGIGLIITERFELATMHWREVAASVFLCFEAIIIAAVTLPGATWLLDKIAERLGLPEYRFSQRESRRRV